MLCVTAYNLLIKETKGTSLVVQWLRLHTPNAGAWVQTLIGELKPQLRIYVLQLKPTAAKYIYIYIYTYTHTHTHIF